LTANANRIRLELVWYPMRELERENDSKQRDVPSLAIVGAGRVGSALARACAAAGVEARLAGREDSAAAAAEAEMVLLCVPDRAIAQACEAFAGTAPKFVGHTSGALGGEPLARGVAAGSATFGFHPLQTIPDRETGVAGAACAVSGSTPEALGHAESLALRLGMRPFELRDDQRAAYHAAAAIASNFLVALEESAVELLERSGIDDARELLAPLVLRSAANWAERGPDALTGPIARGDEETISRHLNAIGGQAPELLELYDALAARTRTLASERSGTLA
jgi:predicted short-subunit dehydrogenase-like oxidoreductase (DUF2520 family)